MINYPRMFHPIGTCMQDKNIKLEYLLIQVLYTHVVHLGAENDPHVYYPRIIVHSTTHVCAPYVRNCKIPFSNSFIMIASCLVYR